ncbi:hypothetical protein QR680_016011 [Steinernema hermaphroditum]|uniref:Hexosyltransferase n=1 Tax=Steinernema hermaphroditum TaxID=289476 RepID=A0AA39LLK9_9BILA|nr:hypothetical protein QR680_016011 [Steinernema hermaphroditum]
MRIVSLRFVLTITAVLLIQIMLFLYWHGERVKRYAFIGHDRVNATFANFYMKYEIMTDFSASRCKGKQLFVFVMTTVSFFEQREVIRRTWATKSHTTDVLVVFIVGKDGNETKMKLLQEENKRYDDIIETTIPDIHAGYYLHTKYCFDVPYILRADDDVIVLPDRLVHFIKSGYFENTEKAIYGITWNDSKPVRDPSHKWYIPKEYFTPDMFPPYANGPAYLMTREAPKAILEKTNETTFFWIEDVMFTGIMANATGVKLVDSKGIFLYHCDQEDEAGRHALRNWGPVGFCMNETSPCDAHGVPYVTIIYHSPDAKRSDMERGYASLIKVKCEGATVAG